VIQLLVTSNVVPSSLILSNLMMEAFLRIGGPYNSRTGSHQRHIPEDGIIHDHRCENLRAYIIHMYVLMYVSNALNVLFVAVTV
jgi:hypothetical protein